jgi:hypothetical protein
VYGKFTDNRLRNCNGVSIYPEFGGVYIAHWAANGGLTYPYICCHAVNFEIRE